jgi:hypothetical protein
MDDASRRSEPGIVDAAKISVSHLTWAPGVNAAAASNQRSAPYLGSFAEPVLPTGCGTMPSSTIPQGFSVPSGVQFPYTFTSRNNINMNMNAQYPQYLHPSVQLYLSMGGALPGGGQHLLGLPLGPNDLSQGSQHSQTNFVNALCSLPSVQQVPSVHVLRDMNVFNSCACHPSAAAQQLHQPSARIDAQIGKKQKMEEELDPITGVFRLLFRP